jgi:hypothetical protein
MPIKCAGAPQKAMYLSADVAPPACSIAWTSSSATRAVLFGVADYVPALMEYVERYAIDLNFGQTLVAVDGPARCATFRRANADGTTALVTREFDMLHVVPPQKAPDFIRSSPLADAAGWIDVDPATLRHKRFGNIFGLGDAGNTTNAKTAAAARKQAPVVAHNVLAERGAAQGEARYDGYGSCPLTVERGKIVLAEFTYGGKVAPTFPSWFIEGKRPRAWHGGSRSASCRRFTGAGCSRAANGSRIPNFRVAARHGLPVVKAGSCASAHAIDQCHGNARSRQHPATDPVRHLDAWMRQPADGYLLGDHPQPAARLHGHHARRQCAGRGADRRRGRSHRPDRQGLLGRPQ